MLRQQIKLQTEHFVPWISGRSTSELSRDYGSLLAGALFRGSLFRLKFDLSEACPRQKLPEHSNDLSLEKLSP
jgi:hypothetical protein